MTNLVLLIEFLPQIIKIIKNSYRNIKVMSQNGIDKEEIKRKLSQLELALTIEDDSESDRVVNDQWVSGSEEGSVSTEVHENKETTSES